MKSLAIVGCGRVIERYYLPALRSSADWRLVAAVDPRPERRHAIGAIVPGVVDCAELDELRADVPIDAVLIASPPESHGRLAAAALERGAHVLLEKPMTPTIAEAEALVALARAQDRFLWVAFNRRFRSSYARLRERLRQRSRDRHVSLCYTLRSDIERWHPVSRYLGSDDLGGGVLDDIASHQLDLLPWLLGLPVQAVSATRATGADGSAIDIQLRFPDGIEARCHAAHGGPSVERLEVTLGRGTLLATRASLIDGRSVPRAFAPSLASMADAADSVVRRLTNRPNATVDSFRRQLAAWAHAIASGRSDTAASGADGLRCVRLATSCRESLARNGAWIMVRSGGTVTA